MTSTLDSCAGTITVELYEEHPDFSGSDGDETECPSCGTLSSSESQAKNGTAEGPAEFKTYDFQYYDLAKERIEADEQSGTLRYFSETARKAMNHHYTIRNQEYMDALLHPKGRFTKCPKGDVMEEPYFLRRRPGPFLSCCFGHSHECGDEFAKMPVNIKPVPFPHLSNRPHHLRERKTKLYGDVKVFKPCKNCETIAFVHHRNPAQHYEDYLNNVTYKSHKNHMKVWPQHLADLKKLLEDNEEAPGLVDLTHIARKCKDYRPSTVAAQASRYTNTLLKKKKVIARKRTPLQLHRPPRRPSSKSSTSKYVGALRGRSREQKRKEPLPSIRESANAPKRTPQRRAQTTMSFRPIRTAKLKLMDLKEKSDSQSPRSSPVTSRLPVGAKMNRTGGVRRLFRPKSALQRTLRASMTTLIKSRKDESAKSFMVKKQKPRKSSKYIQRVKPNISAKFLRAKSKGKTIHRKPSGMSASPSKNTPRERGIRNDENNEHKRILKVVKKPISKLAKSKTESKESSRNSSRDSFTSNSNQEVNEEEEEADKSNSGKSGRESDENETSKSEKGGYSKFRDRNGEFDTEKYRRSILKMLAKHAGTGAKRERKTQQDRSSSQTSSKFAALPKIKNVYYNIKSKTESNVPKRKRKKQGKKSKNDALKEISAISSRSKYALEERDSYFSIPSLDDVKI